MGLKYSWFPRASEPASNDRRQRALNKSRSWAFTHTAVAVYYVEIYIYEYIYVIYVLQLNGATSKLVACIKKEKCARRSWLTNSAELTFLAFSFKKYAVSRWYGLSKLLFYLLIFALFLSSPPSRVCENTFFRRNKNCIFVFIHCRVGKSFFTFCFWHVQLALLNANVN